jgi:rubrerythrin
MRIVKEDESDALVLLIEHEEAVEKLYEAYAQRFPGHRDFWSRLASEEKTHASQLARLKSMPESYVLPAKAQYKPQALALSLAYIRGLTTRAEEQGLTLIKALSYARDVENALIERLFSRIDSAVPPEIAGVFMGLASETERHRNLISRELEAVR